MQKRRARTRTAVAVPDLTDPGLLHARLVDPYAHHYQLIISIFKGVSLFAAAAALHSIVSDGATLGVN